MDEHAQPAIPSLHVALDDGTNFTLSPEEVAAIQVDGPPRRIDLIEAKRCADLFSVRADLDMAATVLDRLIAIRDSPERDRDPVLEHAYWTTALAHYARCFTGGQRVAGLSHSLIERRLPSHFVVLHKWMMDMRNKYLAHDENPYWNFIGSVIIHRTPGGRTLVSPNVAAHGIIALDADRARAVRDLTAAVFDIVQKRIEVERENFVRAIAALPLSEVENLPPVDLNAPTMEDAGKSRTTRPHRRHRR